MTVNDISQKIIGAAFTVSNTLGSGFLEKVYENALIHEIRKSGLKAEQQYKVEVFYDGINVGDYVADIVVADMVLVELKATRSIDDIHIAQCLNYLKATQLPLCLLLNFGTPRVEIKRLKNR